MSEASNEDIDQSEASIYLVVVWLLSLSLHKAILDDREVEASLPRAVGDTGGPGAVTLTQQGGQTRPLIPWLTLKPSIYNS